MSHPTSESVEIPGEVKEGLQRLCRELWRALSETLVSVVVYGGVAKDDHVPGRSEVNVMVVLSDATPATLDKAIGPIREAARDIKAEVFLLTERDLEQSTDVFPVEFLDIQRHHRVLHGRDVVANLQIGREHLRLRSEQEIRSVLFRLRRFYVQHANFPPALEEALIAAVSPLLTSLAVIVELKTGATPITRKEVIDAAEPLGVPADPLREALAVERGELKPRREKLQEIYAQFLGAVEEAANVVDRQNR